LNKVGTVLAFSDAHIPYTGSKMIRHTWIRISITLQNPSGDLNVKHGL